MALEAIRNTQHAIRNSRERSSRMRIARDVSVGDDPFQSAKADFAVCSRELTRHALRLDAIRNTQHAIRNSKSAGKERPDANGA